MKRGRLQGEGQGWARKHGGLLPEESVWGGHVVLEAASVHAAHNQ